MIKINNCENTKLYLKDIVYRKNRRGAYIIYADGSELLVTDESVIEEILYSDIIKKKNYFIYC